MAHPHAPYPSGTFEYPFRDFDLVEVWNGPWASDLPWQADNATALAEWGRGLAADVRQERWRPAIGNSDVHLAGQMGTPQSVVLADELSSAAVLAAAAAGHCWIAESADVDLTFVAAVRGRTAQIGQRLDTGGAEATVSVEVSGVPAGTVTFHTERGVAYTMGLPSGGSGTVSWRTRAGFVRAEVHDATGAMAALTNPVLLV